MIRVLHIMRSLNAGGIGAFVMNVYRKINRNNIQFDFALTNSGMGVFGEEIELLGGKIYFLTTEGNRGLKDGVEQVRNLYHLCRNNNYDIVHCHYYFANAWFLMAAKCAGVPVRVSHCHNAGEVRRVGLSRIIFETVSRKLLFSQGTVFLGCSEAAVVFLYGRNALITGKARILYNGIDYEKFEINKYDIYGLKRHYQVENKHVCVFVGRFEMQKNPIFALEVFREVHRSIRNSVFLMIGYGSLEGEIIKFVRANNLAECVRLLPPDSNVAELQAISEVMIAPSIWEGLSIAYIEAQKMSTVVVASKQISQEVDMGYCEFVSLGEKEDWVNTVMNIKHDNSSNRKYDQEKYNRFDINTTVRNLMGYYGINRDIYAE